MANISAAELVEKLNTNSKLKIKVFNLGENLGMDIAYFCHYHTLKNLFPNITIDLCRSNVDETNALGQDKYIGKVILPVDSFNMEVVKQRYPLDGGIDWIQKLAKGDLNIFSEKFRAVEEYDIIWGIGIGSSPIWLSQFKDKLIVSSNTVREAVESINKARGTVGYNDPTLDFGDSKQYIQKWERTALEYLCYKKNDYPFAFTSEFLNNPLATNYKDYLRISLRWPDNVRWYYSIDRQFEMIFAILDKIRASGRPVNVIYSLKDLEVGNNFLRGQTLELLKKVQDKCDSIIFTYSWTDGPYRGRISEDKELANLKKIGITNIRRLDLWEDLLMSSSCKTYISDPGGFAEAISMLRKDTASTFLLPVSWHHASTYITLNEIGEPIRLKINPLCIEQCYSCDGILSAPDDPEGYRTLYWNMKHKSSVGKIGDNNHGDDHIFFAAAQTGIFQTWYDMTAPALIDAVVQEYLK